MCVSAVCCIPLPSPSSRALVSLLAALISNHRLPESLGSTTSPLTIPSLTSTPSPNTPSHNVHSTYPLRVQLLNFLLPASCHDNNDARGDSGGASGDGVRGGGGGEDGGIGESSEGATSISIFGSSTADIAGSGYIHVHVCHGFEFHLRQLIFLRKSDCLECAVLLCLVCLFDLACFFLSSFSSLIKNMYCTLYASYYGYVYV